MDCNRSDFVYPPWQMGLLVAGREKAGKDQGKIYETVIKIYLTVSTHVIFIG